MKKAFIVIALLTSSFLVSAQDIIVKTNGKKINCKVLDIDSSRVHYVMNQDELRTSIRRSEVMEIQYGSSLPLTQNIKTSVNEKPLQNSVTVGILEGGGSLVGIDYEFLFSKSAGIQLGAGLVGFGLGINIHLKPTIRSTFLSLQYWHQGFGSSYTQSLIGPNIVFRAKKWFTCQIGLGFALEKGPAWPESMTQTPVMLTYAIGGYFPF